MKLNYQLYAAPGSSVNVGADTNGIPDLVGISGLTAPVTVGVPTLESGSTIFVTDTDGSCNATNYIQINYFVGGPIVLSTPYASVEIMTLPTGMVAITQK
jgi:hypothetical protein